MQRGDWQIYVGRSAKARLVVSSMARAHLPSVAVTLRQLDPCPPTILRIINLAQAW